MLNHEEIFSFIYKNNIWGEAPQSKSGFASSVEFNKNFYIPFLKNFIVKNNKIKKICDLGCGDFNFGNLIYDDLTDIQYIGYDCYKELIEENKKKYINYNFVHLDILANPSQIETADLLIAKDIFQHWSNTDIVDFIKILINEKKFKYLLITNGYSSDLSKNKVEDIKTGQYRPISILDFPLDQFDAKIIKIWGDKNKFYDLNGQWFPHLMETSLITTEALEFIKI